MPTPTRSWRQSTGRMPAVAAASMTGVVGYVLRYSTPSRFRISAMASPTCMVCLLLGLRRVGLTIAVFGADGIFGPTRRTRSQRMSHRGSTRTGVTIAAKALLALALGVAVAASAGAQGVVKLPIVAEITGGGA